MPTPIINTLTPNTGYITTIVTIAGLHLDVGNVVVTFNGVTATPNTHSNTQIVVPVPVGAETGNVVVTNLNGPSVGTPFTVQHVNVYQSHVIMSMWVPQEHQKQTGLEEYITLRKCFRGYVRDGVPVRCCQILEDWVDWRPEIRIDIQDEVISEEWHRNPARLYVQSHADYVCHEVLHRWCLMDRTDYVI